jgi:hypothetical protein
MAKARPERKSIVLRGWAVTDTGEAILWHDEASGYDLWFPIRFARQEDTTLIVPEELYRAKVWQAKHTEAYEEREDAKRDRDVERELKRHFMEDAGWLPWRGHPVRQLVLVLLLALLCWLAWKRVR